MKASKILGTLVLSTVALSALASTASAATTVYEEDLNKSNDMQVTVGVKDVIDPEVDPTKPIIDDPTTIKGQIGISQVSPLIFGDVQLTGKKITTPAQFYTRDADKKAIAYTEKLAASYADEAAFPDGVTTPSLQVLDARGTAEGWKVRVKASKLTAGDVEMKGAELVYNAPRITSTTDNTDTSLYPVASADKVVVSAGGSASEILSAEGKTADKDGQGAGTFYVRYTPAAFTIGDKEFKNTPIELNVPSATKKGNYTGTVTYTLTPSGDIVAAK